MLNRDQISPLAEVKKIYIYIYVFITFMSIYMNMMCISYGVIAVACMHPFGLCQAEPGIHRSLDARLSSMQIRVRPHHFPIYLCLNFVYIALCIILHYLSVAH